MKRCTISCMTVFVRRAASRLLLLSACVSLLFGASFAKDKDTFTAVGEMAPAFTLKTLDGASFSTDRSKGKVVVLNFFATWCGPCMAEMPRLEKEVWQHFRGGKFAMIAVAREQTPSDLTPFVKEKGVTFPVASDPKRQVYSLFARQYIPRSYVLDRTGKIVFQSQGYVKPEFDHMIEVITQELGK